jgi:2-polyprenyl-6-methoxyphenol hydroxylase-like FAD-dependent oxidoreductase
MHPDGAKLELKGERKNRNLFIQDIFHGRLPPSWVTGLVATVKAAPEGYSAGANVLTSKVWSLGAPALVIVGDAACATTWRLGYSLQTAMESALALCDSMFKSSNLAQALQTLNNNVIAQNNALARIDRVVRDP